MSTRRGSPTQVAESIPFDNDGNGFAATDVQSAVEEALSLAKSNARISVSCGYTGQGKGQYFHFFKDNPGNENPFVVIGPAILEEISVSLKVNKPGTGNIEVYKNNVLQVTIDMTGVFTKTVTGLNIPLTTGDTLYVFGSNASGVDLEAPTVFLWINKQ